MRPDPFFENYLRRERRRKLLNRVALGLYFAVVFGLLFAMYWHGGR